MAYFGDLSAPEYSSVFLALAENPSISDKYLFKHTSESANCVEGGASKLAFFRKFDVSPVFYPEG